MVLEKDTCGMCAHFTQHYIKVGEAFQWIGDGHCDYPGLKRRGCFTSACKFYQAAQSVAERRKKGGKPGNGQ